MADIKHFEAFEYYYALGSARSYEKVAQKFNTHINTIKKWGSKENWQKEVEFRDVDALYESRKRSRLAHKRKSDQYQNVLKGSLNTYIEKLKKGQIEISTVNDLDKLIRLDLYLDGYVYDAETSLYFEEVERLKEKYKTDEKEGISISFDIKGGVDGED